MTDLEHKSLFLVKSEVLTMEDEQEEYSYVVEATDAKNALDKVEVKYPTDDFLKELKVSVSLIGDTTVLILDQES